MTIVDKINDVLEKNNTYAKSVWKDNGLPVVYVNLNGDWKHTHLYVDYLLKEIGLIKIGEKNVISDGDDWYESTHVYGYISSDLEM